jgi:hypothetical protein
MNNASHRRARPEDAIQRAVTQHYRHVPNGGYRRPIEAAIMKATGTVAGVPISSAICGASIIVLSRRT